MSLLTKANGIALALAAAGLVGCASNGTTETAAASADVHCYGVNKCKGHNDCKTADNACKGHAACKGHGFISMPKAACDHVGGKVGA
jgi:uncharacterized membrane protein